MLEFGKIDGPLDLQLAGNGNVPVVTFEQQLTQILNRMLRDVWAYSEDRADAVYLYIQKDDNTANLDTLYAVKGRIYEAHTLNKSRASKNKKFDTSVERQQRLLTFLSEHLLNSLLPLFSKHDKVFPDEVWASYSLTDNAQRTILGYSTNPVPTVESAMSAWKQEILFPVMDLSWLDNFQIPKVSEI